MPAFKDLTGMLFGNVRVNSRAPNRRLSQRTTVVMWNCTCELCGNNFIVRGNNLTSGNTTTDGCTNKEAISKAQLHDLTGQKFGRLTVIERAPDYKRPDGGSRTAWWCNCDCGKKHIYVKAEHLVGGMTTSCGCYCLEYRSNRYTMDLTGQKFGHLTVIRRVSDPGEPVKWECICDCGTIVIVRATCLRNGDTQSCGCKMFSLGPRRLHYG